ncbi:MAG: hypothetical protein Q9201_000437 [Fulgogasparrea decipioides]
MQRLRAKLRNDFEIVVSDRDQKTLAREDFSVLFEDRMTEDRSQPTGGQSVGGHKPLEKKKMSELLRVATVDNFQGEEAKVVVISLVRSNKEKRIGFLRTTNRINVLISRAQHGLYLIGNTETCSSQPMWAQVLGMLQAGGSVGTAFGLCCPRHTHTELQTQDLSKIRFTFVVQKEVPQYARVDLFEMRSYAEIDVNETPIVVLACGHFFTSDTLDGHMRMTDVHVQDVFGEYSALRDVSAELAQAIPQCPGCQRPVRQHSTQRYSRIMNRAVVDEMSKRFLVNGKNKPMRLEQNTVE